MKVTPAADLDELRFALKAGVLVAFVGAGVSSSVGIPGWGQLVRELTRASSKGIEDSGALLEIESLVQQNRLIDAMSAAEYLLGVPRFTREVQRLLDDRDRDIPEVANALAALVPPLRAIITTNVDGLVERAYRGSWPIYHRPTSDLAGKQGYILKIHGTLGDRRTWVFTREQYDRVMFADAEYRTFFTSMYHAFTYLFVGFGLSDDDLELVAGHVRAHADGQPPKHFALVPAGSASPYRKKRWLDAGVRLVEYDNADGAHAALCVVIQSLGDSTDRVSGPSGAPAAAGMSGVAIADVSASPLWEVRLVATTLVSTIAEHALLRRDQRLGLSFEQGEYIPKFEFLGWASAQFRDLNKYTEGITALIKIALPEALGPLGVAANSEKLVYVGTKLGEAHRGLVGWALGWRRIRTDPVFARLVALASEYANRTIEELEEWGPRLLRQADEFLANRSSDGAAFHATLTLNGPADDAFNDEVERLSKLVSSGRL